ncbi:MAG: helix-turn-helix transcriptional regulator [Epsilonproteobacteria bacterium]|nr:helix-turn-helix transcriptional regulator [Campylobacterota bacterium]
MKESSIDSKQIKEIYKKIGQNVKKKRNEKNISQLTLALAIGHKAVGTISMAEIYLNNKHFNIEHLVKIADVLECDICDFFK